MESLMTNHADSTKHICLQVHDREGTAYIVRLVVAERHETGTLSILTPAGGVAQQFELSHLKKGRDGTQLTCYVSGAAVTLALERDKTLPELHVTASIFFPIFEAVYPLDPREQARFIEWINALSIGIQPSS
jgi:hypothetical protein